MRGSTFWLAAAASAALAAPAFGGTFLLPLNFAPGRDFATIQAGQADNYFTSQGPMRAAGDFVAIDPKGTATKLGAGTSFHEMTVVEALMTAEGTWRISTGDRVGRTTPWVKIGGEWRQVRVPQPAGRSGEGRGGEGRSGPPQVEEDDIPAGAERMTAIQVTKAETYVSKGAPNRAALAASGKGLEFVPVTHPDEIFAGDLFKFSFIMDGQPVEGLTYTVVKGGEQYAESPAHPTGKTDAKGAGSVTLRDPGVYVLEASWPGPGGQPQPGAAPVPVSVAYTLTFEVTR
jgi:hypothetical protein